MALYCITLLKRAVNIVRFSKTETTNINKKIKIPFKSCSALVSRTNLMSAKITSVMNKISIGSFHHTKVFITERNASYQDVKNCIDFVPSDSYSKIILS